MKRILLSISILLNLDLLFPQALAPRALSPSGPVEAYATLGDTVFAVGFFTRVGFKTGSAAWFAGEQSLPQFPITNGDVFAILPDGMGGWYIGGSFTQVGDAARQNLARLLPDGSLDPAFTVSANNEVRCLALQGATLYLGGKFTQVGGQARSYLAAVQGNVPTAWAPNPDNYVQALSADASRLYVGGDFGKIGGVKQAGFAMFSLPAGLMLPSHSPVSGQVKALARSGDRLFAGGNFLGNTGYYSGKAALFPGGAELPAFAFPRFGGTVHALIPDGAGGWYAGGAFTQVNGQASGRLLHILPNFSIDPSFAPAPNGTVHALCLRGDTLYVGGTFSQIAGQNRSNLAALRVSNNSLLPWQPNPDDKVGVIQAAGSRLMIGGSFIRVSGGQQPRLALLDRQSGAVFPTPAPESGEVLSLLQTPLAGGHLLAGGSFSGNVGYSARRAALLSASQEISPPKLPDFNGDLLAAVPDGAGGWYVAGSFFEANGQALSRLAHILPDTTLDLAFSFSLNNSVYALARNGNTLYLGGLFTAVNGVGRNRLAAIDLSSNTLLSWNPDANNAVQALLYAGGQVYAGGSFTQMGGLPRNRLAALDPLTGNMLPTWNPDANGPVHALLLAGGQLYAGGSFTQMSGQARNRLAALDAATGSLEAWNPNANSEVNSLLLSASGTSLYAGGGFSQVGGQTRSRLAEIALGSGNLLPFNPNVSSTVECLALMGGTLYAGGSFLQVGGQARPRLAAIDPASGLPLSWSPAPENTVLCLAVSGSSLLAGGSFDLLDAQPRSWLMDIDPSTLALGIWAPALNQSVNALVLEGGTLIAGGGFTQAGGQARSRLASWNLATQALTTWNPGADDLVSALAFRNDTLFAGGEFLSLGGAARPRLGALKASSSAALAWSPEADNPVLCLAAAGGALAAGGTFDAFQYRLRNRLFCLDLAADTLTAWAPDLPGILFGPRVNALAVSGDSVWVGGYFSALSGIARQNLALTDATTGEVLAPQANTLGEVFALLTEGERLWVGGQLLDSVSHVARPNVAVLDRHSGAVLPFDPAADGYVFCFAEAGGKVGMGGAFEQISSFPRAGGFAFRASTGALLPWNPSLGINSSLQCVALDPQQGHAYIGGFFSTLNGLARKNLARVDLSTGLPDTTWLADANQPVSRLIWDAAGQRLYAAGSFSTLGGQPRSYLGALDAAGNVLPYNPSPNQQVFNIGLHEQGLYVSGSFSSIGGQARGGLALLGSDGSAQPWAPLVETGTGSSGVIRALLCASDRLYIGGYFASVDSQPRHRLAAFDYRSGDLLPWDPAVDEQNFLGSIRVERIAEQDNELFVMGTFSNINGTAVQGFAWMDAASGLVKGMRVQGNGLVNDVAAVDSLLFLGGNFTQLEGQSRFYHAAFSFPQGYFQSGYTGLFPERGGNAGDLTMMIYGSGFGASPQVILRAAGQPDILAFDSLTQVLSGIQIRATFNLRNQPPGFRDVLIVTGADTLRIENGFEIFQGGSAQPWAEAVVPSAMRVIQPGRSSPFVLFVNFGNEGDIDAEGVPIWIAIDSTVEVTKLGFRWIPQVPGAGNPADTSFYAVRVDTVLGEAWGATIYVIVIPRIGAGSQGTLAIHIKPTQVGTVRFNAWASEPLYGSPLKYAVGECMDLLIGKLAGLIPGGGCIYNALDALLSPMFDAAYDTENFATAQWFSSYTVTLANAIVDCGLLATGGGLVLDIVADILSYINTANDFKTLFTSCIPQFPNPKPPGRSSNVGASMDPNQKSGPGGAGPRRWISDRRPMPYLVEFENVDTASAPALEVLVLDTLDASVYDLSSLELNFFTIADTFIRIPRGRQDWTAWIDLRPRISTLVRMEARLEGNVLRWQFESLDPATLAPQAGANEGFLPPNLDGVEGTGSVGFTLERRPGLPTLTEAANRAAIYFDGNAPILTNRWLNTLDSDAPASRVEALDSLQANASFPIRWRGSDFGAGPWYYRLFVSENGGPFILAGDYLEDTTTVFQGQWGYRYEFYTIAVDSAGNAEAAPDSADAWTRVYGALAADPAPQIACRLYPNPSEGRFTLEIEAERSAPASLRVLDLTGRELHRETRRLETGVNSFPMALPLPAGSYLLLIESEGRQARLRFARW
jgi:hypothetical protein